MSNALAEIKAEESQKADAILQFEAEERKRQFDAVSDFNALALALAKDEKVTPAKIRKVLESSGRAAQELEHVSNTMRRAIQLKGVIDENAGAGDELSAVLQKHKKAHAKREAEVKALEEKHRIAAFKEVGERHSLEHKCSQSSRAQRELNDLASNLLVESELKKIGELERQRQAVFSEYNARLTTTVEAQHERDRQLKEIDDEIRFLRQYSKQRLDEVLSGIPHSHVDSDEITPL